MPLYDYKCPKCGYTEEVLLKCSQGLINRCPECLKKDEFILLRRQFSMPCKPVIHGDFWSRNPKVWSDDAPNENRAQEGK